jgi:hypothetical protein
MKYILYLGITVLLSSCNNIEDVTIAAPDGGVGHTLNCSGSSLNMNSCYKKAGEICDKKGYEILDQNNEVGDLFTPTDMRLVIECKK